MRVLVRNLTTGEVLGAAVRPADSFWLRLRGLMFRRGMAPGEGLLLRPCRSVHTHFMRFRIDVLFVDQHWRVVAAVPGMRPWRQSPYVRQAQAVLELPAGAAGLSASGDQLAVTDGL